MKPVMVAEPDIGITLPETAQMSKVEAEGREELCDSLRGMPSRSTRCLERRRGMGVCVFLGYGGSVAGNFAKRKQYEELSHFFRGVP